MKVQDYTYFGHFSVRNFLLGAKHPLVKALRSGCGSVAGTVVQRQQTLVYVGLYVPAMRDLMYLLQWSSAQFRLFMLNILRRRFLILIAEFVHAHPILIPFESDASCSPEPQR